MELVLSMPWLFPKPVFPHFPHAQACLCSCFPRGTLSPLQSWCRLGSRAARKSLCGRRGWFACETKKSHFCSFFSVFLPRERGAGCPCTRFGCGELCSVAQGLQIPQPEMGGRVKNGVRNAHPEGKQMHLWWLCSLRGCGTSDARVDCPVKVEKGRESFQFPAGCRERRGESRALPLTLLRESG